MRAAALSTLLVFAGLPQALAAPKPLAQTFGSNCYARTYDQAHLAKHPRQRVTSIVVRDSVVPAGTHPGIVAIVDIRLKLHGSATAEAVGYCKRDGARLNCTLEGDAGVITLSPQPHDSIILAVEGRFDVETDRGFVELAKGDDRTFALRRSHACR